LGFTWNDLKDPAETTAVPYLSAYGLYKAPEQEWDGTHLRSALFGMMHNQNGFKFKDLESSVKARLGLFQYLPNVLQGTAADYRTRSFVEIDLVSPLRRTATCNFTFNHQIQNSVHRSHGMIFYEEERDAGDQEKTSKDSKVNILLKS
jgi:hypothetical protein